MKNNNSKSQSKILDDERQDPLIGDSRIHPTNSSKYPFWSSLRFKATLFAIAISTIPVITIGVVGYSNNKQKINEQIEQSQKATAEIFADKVSEFLAERYSDIKGISEQDIFSDPKLRNLIDVREKERYLDLYLNFSRGIYQNIVFIDSQGNPIAVAGERITDNYPSQKFFQQALEGKLSISEPLENNAGEKMTILAAPVRDRESGEIIGVIKSAIEIAAIQRIIEDYDKVGHSHLVDSNDRIFLTSEEETLENQQDSQHESSDIKDIFPELLKQRQTAKTGALKTSEQPTDEEVLIGYADIEIAAKLPNLNWYIIVETEAEKAFKVEAALKETFIIGTLGTLGFVTIIAIALTNLSIKPLEATTTAVRQISQGNLAVRVPVTGADELARLAANTNRMADKIEQLIEAEQENATKLSERNNLVSKLLNLVRNEILLQGNIQQVAKEFTKAAAIALGVEIVSIWLYDEERETLTCLDRYQADLGEHTRDEIIAATEFPQYFQALAQQKIIATDERQEHLALAELKNKQQLAPATTATLNIPIITGGITVGLLRCEQIAKSRQWSSEEQSFSNSLANLIALSLESEYLQNEVEHLLEVVCSLEDGNLTVKAKVSERVTGLVADTLNRLSEEMARIMLEVLEVALKVQQGATQQKELASVLSNNTDRQAKGALEVLQLTQEVAKISRDSAQKIQTTNKSLLELGDTVERGHQVLVDLTADINTLQQGTDRIVQQMKTLGEFVGLADRFVQDQTEIASLTQVLAMNASLVAARAAQQKDPQQFALVAREFESIANQVSSLAQQTTEGLDNLEQRSAQIHKAVSGVDADVQNLGGLVRQFTKAVEHSGTIFTNVEKVTAIAVESDRASVESARVIINAARTTAEVMQDIAALASETADLTKATKSQSIAMQNLSTQMLETIEFFQLPQAPEGQNNNNNKLPDRTASEETSISSTT